MSYGRTLKGDKIIPTTDFKDMNNDNISMTEIPPLLNPKRLSRMPTSVPPCRRKVHYSRVPEPTSLEINKRAISHSITTMKQTDETKMGKLAKRVSSLQDTLFRPKMDTGLSPKATTAVQLPEITKKHLSINVPFVDKFEHEDIEFCSPNLIKRLTNRFKPSSPLSEFQDSIADSSILPAEMEMEEDLGDVSSDDLVDMDKRVFVNNDHISVNIDSSASSILSSVLYHYSNLSEEDTSEIKMIHSNDMKPIHVQLPYSIHTPTNSIFSEYQTTTPSSKQTGSEVMLDFEDDISVSSETKLPMEIYNVKLTKSPINQFQIRQYTNQKERSIIIDNSLPPPTPKHQFNVSPSTTYYTCKSSIKSSSSSLYSSKIPIDYTDLKAFPYTEQIKIPENTEMFTRKPQVNHSRNASSLTTKSNYMEFDVSDALEFNDQGDFPTDVKLTVVNP